MNSLSLLLLFIGSLMLVSGMTKQNMRQQKNKVVYRYISKPLYDKQFENIDLMKSMPAVFSGTMRNIF